MCPSVEPGTRVGSPHGGPRGASSAIASFLSKHVVFVLRVHKMTPRCTRCVGRSKFKRRVGAEGNRTSAELNPTHKPHFFYCFYRFFSFFFCVFSSSKKKRTKRIHNLRWRTTHWEKQLVRIPWSERATLRVSPSHVWHNLKKRRRVSAASSNTLVESQPGKKGKKNTFVSMWRRGLVPVIAAREFEWNTRCSRCHTHKKVISGPMIVKLRPKTIESFPKKEKETNILRTRVVIVCTCQRSACSTFVERSSHWKNLLCIIKC